MAAARLSILILCRRCPPLSFSPSPLSHASRPLRLRLCLLPTAVPPPSLLSRTSSPASLSFSTSSAAASDTADGCGETPHPWPEWDGFLEKLKSKGYFKISSPESAEGEVGAAHAAGTPGSTDVNRIKNACLSFARERFDLFRSLPREDIQAVVECGCPNLFRKAVNSAKRLRAHLRLDEGDVCSGCNLRGSCDKAYVIAKDDEGARTVDIMRILLYYAIDPVLLSGGENPPIKETVQESARKLFAELNRLSDTTIDPALPKPAPISPIQKEPNKKSTGQDRQSRNVEMKRGDWICPSCNFLNFARNLRCLECKEAGPKRVESNNVEMKLGDWTCPQCQFMNFSRNKKCFRCQQSRPQRELNPGEWECPSCDFLNFRRNMVCKKCNCDRPKDDNHHFEEHVWRKPKSTSRDGPLQFGDDEDEVDDDNDDILPLQGGENKFVVNKRATPSERRWTSARRQDYSL